MSSTEDGSTSCVCVLAGIPAAGKSSIARALSEQLEAEGVPCMHVCFDVIYEELNSARASASAETDFSPEVWQSARNEAQRRTENFLETCTTSGHRGGVAFIDDNMHYRSMRHEYFRLAQRCESEFFCD